jgi:peroxiredoxin
MPALKAGTLAPDFSLPTTDGKRFSLADARRRGPVVVAFFKVSCPVCQFAFPYLQRLHEMYGDERLTVVGVSQNLLRETVSFMRDYGISFPVALDDTHTYPVSNQYGLTTVPSIFLVGRDGRIQASMVGWSRQEMEDVSVALAHDTAATRGRIFHPGEDVPEFKAG